ncbi:M20/M25/M40 family metallo-hydrolase [Nocardioides sp. HDW12B]|uniref:M20/M25/M40 family metallo-hydrolase n=1 Tax=Nocardioides sp. HDW12B TaxID=2714939 RepID=UPI00140B9834|nr:M20/M25/M40 family metallo-hydrolase [Nocardioides sp. HDW12B]QIK67797.1 M20/M25/M40 family metallo-hydrolase [Nocardioides sp. HDW12B]
MPPRTSRRTMSGLAGAAVLGLLASPLAAVTTADAAPGATGEVRSTQGLRNGVTVAGITEHLAALQAISDANGGNRVSGFGGYDASKDYAVERLEAAGYDVTVQPFPFPYDADRTPAVLQQVSPGSSSWVDGVDYASMTYSGNGDVTGAVTAVDLVVPPTPAANGSTSGCEAADFAGFPVGTVALLQRGSCDFRVKALNAQAAGATAAIIFNEGQPGRTAVLSGTLGSPGVTIPVVGTTFAVGDQLRNNVRNGATGSTARVRVDRVQETRTTYNVIADSPTGDPNRTVVVGAHLDSVPRGPGINDNGSGSAGIIEIAEQMAARDIAPRNRVRFALWGAEEFGLLGSEHYVGELSAAEKDEIELNLNFDMVGSPNYVRFVYDGDNSAFPVGAGAAAGPQGSGEIERVFHDYFKGVGLASAETPFSGRSDYGPFIAEGIPAGGLFTGAEGVKTAEQAAVFGGTAGLAYDPCYHLACDTIDNVSRSAIDEMVDAAAHTTLTFAKRNFAKDPLVNPARKSSGVTGTAGGGGLHDHDDHDVVDR